MLHCSSQEVSRRRRLAKNGLTIDLLTDGLPPCPTTKRKAAPPEIIDAERSAYRDKVRDPDPDWPPDVRAVYCTCRERLFEMGLEAQEVTDNLGIRNHNIYSRFRYFTGQRIKEWIIQHRLRLAKRFLRRTSLSGTWIAFAVGYESSSGFCTTFKRREGCTPTAFREREEE
ncbi:MAG: helix-turn-helix transcriptional regulator [Salinibacter sp.]|uniref:helix-turn-helix transcriptional regulator n=1 Tax=Salinibacter sp. TaxID=2065818 RepID=UPI0035D49C37